MVKDQNYHNLHCSFIKWLVHISNIYFGYDRMVYRLLIILFTINLTSIGCEKNTHNPENMEDDPLYIEKSFKRGISYNLTDPADFDTLKSSVSWWYNWYWTTEASENYYVDYQMEFIPMFWGGNTSLLAISNVKSYIFDHPEIKYLLVLNEPNLIDQANRTPVQAANDWIVFEEIIGDLSNSGRDVYLVGPAMTWGTMENYSDPVVWLDAFYEAFNALTGRDPKIDYLAFHWYDYGLEAQLDRLAKYGKQIWITEMANWNAQINSYNKQITEMTKMVSICESRDDVFRYAWFIGRGDNLDNHYTYLFESTPGQLTELGQIYINLPFGN